MNTGYGSHKLEYSLNTLLNYLLTVFGFFLVSLPLVGIANPRFLVYEQVYLVSLFVAFPAAVVYRWRGGRLGELGDFIFTGLVAIFVMGLGVMVVLGVLDMAPTTGSTGSLVMELVFFPIAYATTYIVVRYRNQNR
ncbi:MAG: hypothetical protein SXQ77_04865 [Halobacteria archaeon]|nr:hypothetical protein [Halobacteria archaeon]